MCFTVMCARRKWEGEVGLRDPGHIHVQTFVQMSMHCSVPLMYIVLTVIDCHPGRKKVFAVCLLKGQLHSTALAHVCCTGPFRIWLR